MKHLAVRGRKRYFFIATAITLAIITAAAIGIVKSKSNTADALSGSGFDPARIIDDSVFYNSNAIDASKIQTFLNSKVKSCDTQGSQPASEWGRPDLTRAQFATQVKGWHGPPYTCMRDFKQNTPQVEAASGYCGAIPSRTNYTAAQIIDTISKACGINPQVLIVLLEKEQSLVNDIWPLNSQYERATGFACPDNAGGACDPAFNGFFRQVYSAARQFKIYQAFPNSYNYRSAQSNRVYWQVNLGGFVNPTGNANDPSRAGRSECGYQNVTIQNQATAALYIYTPYQPNGSALNNPYGTGDACSAYGNRNFWRMFSDWFGSTLGIPESNLYIPNGNYSIVNQTSGRSIDVAGGRTSNGTTVQLYSQNNTAAQKWYFERDTEGYYTLKNINSGRYLDVANASQLSGSTVQIWDGNTTCAQKWALVNDGERMHILNKCSGLSLDVAGGQLLNGARLQTWSKNTSGAQIWGLISHEAAPISDGFYEVNSSGGLALEIAGGSISNGTKVQLWNSNQSPSQHWQVTKRTDGLYSIRNPASGRYMDVVNADVSAGAEVHIFDGGATCAQKWAITGDSNSGYVIQSSCSDKVLDVVNANLTVPGAKIQIWDRNDTAAQRWYFIKQSINPPNGLYSLSTNKRLALEISGGSTLNGTQLQLWSANRSPSQHWQLTRLANGQYSIRNPASGRYMDITAGRIANGSPVQIWDTNESCAQKWNIQSGNDGTFAILSACANNLALDVAGGLIGNLGAKVQIYSKNNSSAQSWRIGNP